MGIGGSVRYYKVVWGYCMVLQEPVEYYKVLQRNAEYCEVLRRTAGYTRGLLGGNYLGTVKYCRFSAELGGGLQYS